MSGQFMKMAVKSACWSETRPKYKPTSCEMKSNRYWMPEQLQNRDRLPLPDKSLPPRRWMTLRKRNQRNSLKPIDSSMRKLKSSNVC